MDETEKAKLIADIKAEVIKELTGKDLKSANSKSGPLDQMRGKYKKPLYEKYGTYYYTQVWENIRRLSCYMVGVRYVRDLTPSKEDEAAQIAERFCDMALNPSKEVKDVA